MPKVSNHGSDFKVKRPVPLKKIKIRNKRGSTKATLVVTAPASG